MSHAVVLTAVARNRPATDTSLTHSTSYSSPLFVRTNSTRKFDTGRVSDEADIIRTHRATSGNVTQPRWSSNELHVYNTIYNARHANHRQLRHQMHSEPHHRHPSHHRYIVLTPRNPESRQPPGVSRFYETIPAREPRWRFETPYSKKRGCYRGDVVDDEDEEEDQEEEQDMMHEKCELEKPRREKEEKVVLQIRDRHQDHRVHGGGYYNPIPVINVRSLRPKGPPVPYSGGGGYDREGEISQQIENLAKDLEQLRSAWRQRVSLG